MILDEDIKKIIEDDSLTEYAKGEAVWKKKKRICQQNNIQGKTRPFLARVVGVGEATMGRIKYIMEYGTEDQKRRARQGGRELDGTSNQIWVIATEIKDKNYMLPYKPVSKPVLIKPVEETRVCKVCGQEKPIKSFVNNGHGYRISVCNSCRWQRDKKKKQEKELQGEKPINMSEEALNNYLYDTDKDVGYTIDDLVEEMLINGKNGIKSVETSLEIHKDLLTTEENKQKALESLKTLSHRLYELQLRFKD